MLSWLLSTPDEAMPWFVLRGVVMGVATGGIPTESRFLPTGGEAVRVTTDSSGRITARTLIVNGADDRIIDLEDMWIAQGLILTYRGLGGGWEARDREDFVPVETLEAMRERTDWGGILPDKEDVREAPETGEDSGGVDSYFRWPDW